MRRPKLLGLWAISCLALASLAAVPALAMPSQGPSGKIPALLDGDINGDGFVDFSDYLVMEANFGSQNADRAHGDLDNSHTVNFGDYLVLEANFGKMYQPETPPRQEVIGSVPEPMTLMATCLGLAGVGGYIRKRLGR